MDISHGNDIPLPAGELSGTAAERTVPLRASGT
jgi:hypothetical protein